jgi:hypothetical protein
MFPRTVLRALSITLLAACATDRPPAPAHDGRLDRALAPSRVVWSQRLSDEPRCTDETLEIVMPYLEGLRIKHPARALQALGSKDSYLSYPSALSMPFVGYTCDGTLWRAVYAADFMRAPPVDVVFKTSGGGAELRFECLGECSLRTTTVRGTWSDLAKAVAEVVPVPKSPQPLAERFRDMKYFVNQWIDVDSADQPLRVDWDVPSLVQQMKRESKTSIVFLYGLDPGAVDLEGKYLWSEGAEKAAREIVKANPAVAHEFWLNLRTYKYAIPKLGIDKAIPPEVLEAAKLYPDGIHDGQQYGFRWKEMCPASATWQAMRLRELKHLIDVGFRIIALDEFPLGARWDSAPCLSRTHLHHPADFADEWRVTLEFVQWLSAYAREHGVLLTSEEPSAALLPYAAGYTNGMFNQPRDVMYSHWAKSPDIEPVPLFSTMFKNIVTPYTRTDFKGPPPPGWIAQYKVSR